MVFPYTGLLKGGLALHIPDGFLSLAISLIFWLITIAFLAVAVRKTQHDLGERQIPLMGVMAAFIFAAQMINFPVAGGTSGHLLGGVLAAIVLGPWAGILVMTAVVALQALLFQDGGLLVMGANIFNMGILTVLVGYGLYRFTISAPFGVKMGVAGMAAWLSVMAAALMTALQLWLSGTSPLTIVLPAMLGVHALIGLGEALITVAALTFIHRTRPDILSSESGRQQGGWGWAVGGMVVVMVVVLFAPWASSNPDGLERVAEDLGFLGQASVTPRSFLADYAVPFISDSNLSTIIAGGMGVLVIAGLVITLGRALRNKNASVSKAG